MAGVVDRLDMAPEKRHLLAKYTLIPKQGNGMHNLHKLPHYTAALYLMDCITIEVGLAASIFLNGILPSTI